MEYNLSENIIIFSIIINKFIIIYIFVWTTNEIDLYKAFFILDSFLKLLLWIIWIILTRICLEEILSSLLPIIIMIFYDFV